MGEEQEGIFVLKIHAKHDRSFVGVAARVVDIFVASFAAIGWAVFVGICQC